MIFPPAPTTTAIHPVAHHHHLSSQPLNIRWILLFRDHAVTRSGCYYFCSAKDKPLSNSKQSRVTVQINSRRGLND